MKKSLPVKNHGKLSRTKGASAERESAKMWHEIGFPFAKRNLGQYQERSGIDLQNTEPYDVQVKCGKHVGLWEAFKEVCRDRKPGHTPIVMAKRDREDWVVMMSWKAFKSFLVK